MALKELLKKVVDKQDLTENEMRECMVEIMEGEASDILISSFLTALRMKVECVDEITAAAKVMREKVVSINSHYPEVVDTCGTGGDGANTFNISTAAAILAASAGAKVAKHGNRSVSSKCGSADVLKALGINVELSSIRMEEVLNNEGIAFLFAPLLHPAMKNVMPVRKELGMRTIFNVLGPLTNPAGAKNQVMGVYSRDLVEPITYTLQNLGSTRAFVVHSEDGLDEVSIAAPTFVGELKDGNVTFYTVKPEDFGLKTQDIALLKGGDMIENKGIVESVLAGETGARRDVAVLNAAFALVAFGAEKDVKAAIAKINSSIDSGEAFKKFENFRDATNL